MKAQRYSCKIHYCLYHSSLASSIGHISIVLQIVLTDHGLMNFGASTVVGTAFVLDMSGSLLLNGSAAPAAIFHQLPVQTIISTKYK